jgi:hypothetical protein
MIEHFSLKPKLEPLPEAVWQELLKKDQELGEKNRSIRIKLVMPDGNTLCFIIQDFYQSQYFSKEGGGREKHSFRSGYEVNTYGSSFPEPPDQEAETSEEIIINVPEQLEAWTLIKQIGAGKTSTKILTSLKEVQTSERAVQGLENEADRTMASFEISIDYEQKKITLTAPEENDSATSLLPKDYKWEIVSPTVKERLPQAELLTNN